MSFFDITLVIFAIVNLLFAGVVYYHSKRDNVVIFYGLISIFASLWSLSTLATKIYFLNSFFFQKSVEAHYIFGNLAYLSFLWLAFYYPDVNKKPTWVLKIFTILNLFITSLVLLPGFLFESVYYSVNYGLKINFNVHGYAIFIISLTSVFALGLFYLIRKIKMFLNVRKEIYYLILANFVAGSLGIYLNLVLPLYGNFSLFYLNPILVTLALTGIGVFNLYRNKLFNMKVALAELLTFGIWIALLFEFFLSKTLSDRIIKGSIFILIVIFGLFLLKSVYKEIRQREEIERLANQLTTANARLKELDKLKSEFVSIASHQLRSPLTAIKGYASLILDGSYGKITYGVHEAVNKMFQSSVSLVVMIEDFLNISRIEQGTMKYNLETADIQDLIKKVVGEQEANVERVGLKISFSTDKKPPYLVSIDVNKIRQVITNLIDNSVKYTPKGSISVRLYKEPARNKIVFSISDTGVGIDKETIPQLFAKFSRAKDANKVNVVGAGLGLYVVKEIVNGHKGRVWVTSDGKGKGSNFFVEFDENLEAARVNRVNDFAKTV